jgi:uroporphyrin-III C-methyltransferase/precorrin-2 dehydrogenase/sirohydrochlorin ferrochelatase
MDVLPIALKLNNQQCLIVGGGKIARRKADLLLQAGARLDIVALDVIPELDEMAKSSGGSVFLVPYTSDFDLQPYRLVIAATDDPDVNQQVFHDCEALRILVNSVDDPPHCRFIVPAIVDRSPLLISISSGGKSPVLARQLRTKIESLVPAKYGDLSKFSGDWRPQVKAAIVNPDERRIFWEDLYAGSIGEQVLNGQRMEADATMPQALADWLADTSTKGEVYLVGAGPGDPDLLTFRALRLMQQADVVVYDRLVSAPIMSLVRRDAERVYVGKARANHAVPQENINQLLVRLAKEGKRVCRLKGGDPFIFGRGGEEIEELVAAGVAFQVVPGITAASGCSAYAGIPLTHRDYAQSVRFLTGHLKDGSPSLPWSELIYENQTLVLYMGLVGLRNTCQQLMLHGLRGDMPIALISKGTTPDQHVVVGTIETIADMIDEQKVVAPTLTIIGEVVKLRDKLKWFD